MKNKIFKLKPTTRFAVAFWLGWLFHFACQLLVITWRDEAWIGLGFAVASAFVVITIYTRNKVKFEHEFVWMNLRNPERKHPEELGQ